MDGMKPTVYVETSVISYYTARISRDLIVAGHQQITQEWWETALPNCDPVVSQAVLDEIARGDPVSAQQRADAIRTARVLPILEEVVMLAAEYFIRLSMPEKARTDSVHLWRRGIRWTTWLRGTAPTWPRHECDGFWMRSTDITAFGLPGSARPRS